MFILLLFAILSEKRIIFLGYGIQTYKVSEFVQACIAIASGGGLIPNVSTRFFPYASLANIDALLKIPGYIAGVTNPVFEEQSGWWDILINISAKTMQISPKLCKLVIPTESRPPISEQAEKFVPVCPIDECFNTEMVQLIADHVDEIHVRQHIYSYIEKVFDISKSAGTITDPLWIKRIDGFISAKSYNDLTNCVLSSLLTIGYGSE